MDAFFASVEQRDNPELRGRPVVVGGTPDGRGVVAAASYEARRYGIRSAMPCAKAARLCRDVVFVRTNFERYREVGQQVRDIFYRWTDLVEPLSIDEAFLDVTENHMGEPLGSVVASAIRAQILEETGLTASAGVAPVKFVAKIASDYRKPNGLTVVAPERVLQFIHPLSVERLWGVGPATASRLHALGLITIGDVASLKAEDLEQQLGRLGLHLWKLSQGIDERPVRARSGRKSRGSERTFGDDLTSRAEVLASLEAQVVRVCEGAAQAGQPGRTITLKVRYDDFTTLTRSHSLAVPTADAEVVMEVVRHLLDKTDVGERPVRLVGVSLGGLHQPGKGGLQLSLPLGSSPAEEG